MNPDHHGSILNKCRPFLDGIIQQRLSLSGRLPQLTIIFQINGIKIYKINIKYIGKVFTTQKRGILTGIEKFI